MPNFSQATLMGHLTRDPEVRNAGEHLVAAFSVAVTRKVKGQDEVSYFDCKAWNERAQFVEKYFKKGDAVLVTGELVTESWEDKQSGAKRSRIVCVVDRCTFAGGGSRSGGGGNTGGNRGGGRYGNDQRQRHDDRRHAPAPDDDPSSGGEAAINEGDVPF